MDVLIFLIQWYSFIALKFMNNNAKAKLRDVEHIETKLVTLKLSYFFCCTVITFTCEPISTLNPLLKQNVYQFVSNLSFFYQSFPFPTPLSPIFITPSILSEVYNITVQKIFRSSSTSLFSPKFCANQFFRSQNVNSASPFFSIRRATITKFCSPSWGDR